ncbi:hypothetical protein GCM10009857_30620 [Agromyces soli]
MEYEVLAARQAASNRSIEQAAALREAAAAFGLVTATAPHEAADAERGFRRCLTDAAQVPLLLESLELLAERSPARPTALAAVAYAHLAVAVSDADADGAEAVVRTLHAAEQRLRRTEVLRPLRGRREPDG